MIDSSVCYCSDLSIINEGGKKSTGKGGTDKAKAIKN